MKDGEAVVAVKEKDGSLPNRGRYKFWTLVLIVFLAFWSMLAGSVSLKWSARHLSFFGDELSRRIHDDFDVLEIEAREKVVRHMWDVYVHNPRLKLTRFWQEAFRAAYEELECEDPGVRDRAITEIAKMSLRSLDMDFATQKLKRNSGNHEKVNGKKISVQRKIK